MEAGTELRAGRPHHRRPSRRRRVIPPELAENARSFRSRCSARQLSNPFLAARLLAARPPPHRRRAASATGSCSARCSSRSSTAPAAGRQHGPARRRPRSPHSPPGLELMHHQARFIESVRAGPPHLPARRRAGPRQDRAGAPRRLGRRRVPAARRRAERREDELGARGRALDAAPHAPRSSTATARTSTRSPTS